MTTSRQRRVSALAPVRAFWAVFFPLSLPGLLAGALIVFILCLGFYVTPAVLGGGKVIMVSNRIANDIEIFFNWGAASALGVVLLVLTLLPACSASRLLRPERISAGGHDADELARPPRHRDANHASRAALALCACGCWCWSSSSCRH